MNTINQTSMEVFGFEDQSFDDLTKPPGILPLQHLMKSYEQLIIEIEADLTQIAEFKNSKEFGQVHPIRLIPGLMTTEVLSATLSIAKAKVAELQTHINKLFNESLPDSLKHNENSAD